MEPTVRMRPAALRSAGDRLPDRHLARARAAIAQTAFDVPGTLTCSFGVTEYADGDTPESFVARADRALYQAKLKGRDRVELAVKDDLAQTGFASVA